MPVARAGVAGRKAQSPERAIVNRGLRAPQRAPIEAAPQLNESTVFVWLRLLGRVEAKPARAVRASGFDRAIRMI